MMREAGSLPPASAVLPTTHPSVVLRSRNRDEDFQLLVDDLRVAANVLG